MSADEFINAVEDYDEENPAHDNPIIRAAFKCYDDKWGPAVCVKRKNAEGKTEYVFFGWASD